MKNLFEAWKEFRRGKRNKLEIQNFEFNLEDHIFQLHEELRDGKWIPKPYQSFFVKDPKLRHIHKADVRDRVLNQALFRILYPIFDKHFIFDSYSCRNKKGTHRGVLRLDDFIRGLSQNYSRPVFVLKCDIRKFFDSISHQILFSLVKKRVSDGEVLKVIQTIISSFSVVPGKGLPLGNVTSQLFANVYLNEFDQFIKHVLKVKYYLRYCDDFIILERDGEKLESFVLQVNSFLKEKLKLNLHPNKISIRKATQGIDFLGYVLMPHHKILRTKTRRRILKKIKVLKSNLKAGVIEQKKFDATIQSYLGVLAHCRGYKIEQKIQKLC